EPGKSRIGVANGEDSKTPEACIWYFQPACAIYARENPRTRCSFLARISAMAADVEFARMNGLGNVILVVDMRGRDDVVTPQAAIALNADPATRFDQIMAIHDPKVDDTDAFINILNCDGTRAQACGNGTRCVVQALAAETGKKAFTFQTVA